jgi:hypothetical protein
LVGRRLRWPLAAAGERARGFEAAEAERRAPQSEAQNERGKEQVFIQFRGFTWAGPDFM